MRHIYKEYHVICDKCECGLMDYVTSVLYSPKERDKEMDRHGWIRIKKFDYCDKCKLEEIK